jgi:U3 small nucleolar RNA-associated protein 13
LEPIYSGGRVQVFKPSPNEPELLLLQTAGTLHIRNPCTGKSLLKLDSPVASFSVAGADEAEETGAGWQNFLAQKDSLYTVNRDGLVESWAINGLGTPETGSDCASASLSLSLKRSWKGGNTRNSPVVVMEHHPVSPLLVLAFSDGSISVWDSTQGYCTHNFKAKKVTPVSLVRFHPNPEVMQMFAAWEDGTVSVFDLKQSQSIKTFQAHVSAVTGLAVMDKSTVVTVGRDRVLNIYSNLLHQQATPKPSKTLSLQESAEGLLLLNELEAAVIGDKGTVSVWNLKEGRCTRTSVQLSSAQLTQIHACSSGALVVSSELQLITLNPSTLQPIHRLIGHCGEVTDFALIGSNSLAVATNGSELCLFDSVDSMACRLLPGHSEAILAVAYASEGQFIVTGSRDSTVRVWGLDAANDGESLARQAIVGEGHTDAVSAVAVGARLGTNSQFSIASVSSDLTLKMWLYDAAEHVLKSSWTVKAHEKDINAVCFSPDHRLVLTAAQDKTVKAWDVQSGKLVHTFTGHKRGVWSLASGINSQGEACLATGSADRTIKLWKLGGEYGCTRTFEGHSNSVLKVAFVTACSQIISAGSDGLIKVWSVQANECLTTLDEHVDRVWALLVEKDGDRFVSGDASACIRVWRDATEEEQEESRAARQELILKEQELEVHLLRKDFTRAVSLAMSLDQPFRLCSLFEELLRTKSVAEGIQLVQPLLAGFTDDQRAKLLEYIREWNLSYRRAWPSQIVLASLIRDQEAFNRLLNERSGVKDLLKGILPYAKKHFERTDELLISSHLVDLALLNMN